MRDQWTITWVDRGREPTCAPDPHYPQGIDVDMAADAVVRCKTALPYPARRCGYFVFKCRLCGLRGVITTAGRPDDPRSITVACKGGYGNGDL